MAQFTAQCPHCKQQFNAQTEWIGQQASCPACGKLFTITAPTQTPNVMPEPNKGFMAQCPHCKNQFNAQADWVGQQTNCPNCGNNFIIAKSAEKKEFWEIIKGSKTLIPDAVVGGIFLASFAIYFIWLMWGFAQFNDELIRSMGSTIYSPLDILCFNCPTETAWYESFIGINLQKFIDNVLPFILLGVSGCYFAGAILNHTVFRRIQMIASGICLGLVLIVFAIINIHALDKLDRNYDGAFSICYSLSTLFYVFILSLATIAFSVWMKYKLYLQECSNGEKIEFMDFIKKLLKWDML